MQFDLRRRKFITLLGGAVAAWPLAAQAQQPPLPVVGFLHSSSPENSGNRVPALRQGLKEMGFIENENATIEYRWADNQVDSLARPGGNLTGVNFFAVEVAAKRLELLRELVPGARRIAALFDPANAAT